MTQATEGCSALSGEAEFGLWRAWLGSTGLHSRAVTSPHSLPAKESTNRQRRQAGATWLSPILLALTWLQRRSPLRSRPVIPGAPRPNATGVAFERAFPRLSPTRVVGEPSPRGAAWASCRDSAARCLAGYGVVSHPASQAPAQTSFKCDQAGAHCLRCHAERLLPHQDLVIHGAIMRDRTRWDQRALAQAPLGACHAWDTMLPSCLLDGRPAPQMTTELRNKRKLNAAWSPTRIGSTRRPSRSGCQEEPHTERLRCGPRETLAR
jgi:hypothetical protein